MQSIGGVRYSLLDRGIQRYSPYIDQIPNLSGFPTIVGEKDFDWVTVTNYIAMAKLNSEQSPDIEGLIKNYYLLHYGKDTVDAVYEAMEHFQDVLNDYAYGYGGIPEYQDCFRTHNAFGLTRIKGLTIDELNEGLNNMKLFYKKMKTAEDLLFSIENKVNPTYKKNFDDLMIQTKWFRMWFESRFYIAEAFVAKKQRKFDLFAEKLRKVKEMNIELNELASMKPNISDYFEMEGMKQAINIIGGVQKENSQIDELIAPENIALMKRTFVISGQPYSADVLGNIGTKAVIEFDNIKNIKKIGSAKISFYITDLDGSKDGEEAVLRIFDDEIKLPPTENGQTKFMSYDININELKNNDKITAEFVLVGKPGGTAGFFVNSAKLELLQKEE
ncbi:MAG: hypothetical protein SNJ70_04690 [Armatimonadota bacterium]